MVPPLLAHQAPGFQALGFSPGLTLYLTVALLGLVALWLRVSWSEARLPAVGEVAPPATALDRVAGGVLRGVGVALLALLLACGWLGGHQIGANPISNAVFWLFWIGGQLLALVVGDWWHAINPYDTIAGWVDRRRGGEAGDRGADAGDWIVPGLLLFSFLWLWLCWFPAGTRPRSIAAWLTAYTVVMVAGALRGGRSWVRRNDAFAIVFGLIASCSPVAWSGVRPRWRNPLAGMAARVVGRRELAVLAVMLGGALFDAVGTSAWFADLVGARDDVGYTAFNTFGLLWLIGSAALVWIAAARAAVALAAPHQIEVELSDRDPAAIEEEQDDATRSAPLRLAAPLALLAAGFAVAHESSALLVNSQNLLAQLSDPFAQGWDLLGTGTIVVDQSFPSAGGQAWISLLLIEIALLGTFVGLHDRVLARFGPGRGAQASWAMLGFAVVAAVAALKLLLGV